MNRHLLGEGFGDVDLAQWDQPFAFCVELRLVLIDQINEFVAVDELKIALCGGKVACPLVEAASRDEESEVRYVPLHLTPDGGPICLFSPFQLFRFTVCYEFDVPWRNSQRLDNFWIEGSNPSTGDGSKPKFWVPRHT